MQRVLVTGASGYIGQHLVESLRVNDIIIRGFSRKPKPDHLSVREWYQGDICHLSDADQAVQGCNVIIHLACSPLGQSWQDPVYDFQVNALGTLNVLQAAQTRGVRRVVYVSTAQVYGFVEHLPLREQMPTQPNSPYAASKLCGEILCTTFARCYGTGMVILRLFNVYGTSVDRRKRATVEEIFIRRIVQGSPPIIKANPEEARDFIYVEDVTRAIRLVLEKPLTNEIINIGTGKMTTLLELAETVIALSGLKMEPIIEKTNIPPARMQADIHRAKQILNFEAKVSLSEGLSRMFKLEQSY